MKTIVVNAMIENLIDVQSVIEKELIRVNASMKVIAQVAVAVEEIYVNIAHYAYEDAIGKAIINCDITDKKVILKFSDGGRQFNPLIKEDPNIKLTAEERKIGGLGILMVKKMMDNVTYSFEEGMNVLTIEKNIS